MSTRTVARQCTLCEAHCGILVTVEDERVTRIEGNREDVLSKGYICPKATAMGGLHHDPDRLRTPVRRIGERFEPIGWDEAFNEIGQRLRAIRSAHGPSAIGMYMGNPAAHSTSVLYGGLLRAALMTRNFFSASSIDQFPQEFTAWRMFGSNALMPVADIDRTDRLVILGANPAVSNGSITTMPGAKQRIRDVRARGGSVVVIDPRRTETARLADEHVAVAPGGDVYLLLGMLHVLVTEELCDQRAVREQCAGWERLRRLVAGTTPESMAPHAGVDAETIRRLARDHAAAPSAVLYARIGVCQQVTGTLTHWLVNTINAVTGNLDRAGGQMFGTPPVDAARYAKYLPMGHGAWTDRTGAHKSFRSELPVGVLADEILTEGPGQIKAMITYAGNPVLSTPQGGRLEAALSSLDFYVAVDMYITETTRHADIILPPVSPLEREELNILFPVFSVRNNARYDAKVFEPPADAMEDWQILARLITEVVPLPVRRVTGRAVNAVFAQLSPQRMVAAAVATGPYGVLRKGRKGLTVKRIREAAGGIDLGPLRPRLPELIGTRDRKVQLVPPDFLRAVTSVLDDAAAGQALTAPGEGFDLKLIGRRHLRSNNSWLHNIPTMMKGRDRCTVLMHPVDATERGLADGDSATVASPVGEITLPVEISDDIRRGVVAIPHGWGHGAPGVGWSVAAAQPGVNVNLLHDPSLTDPLSGAAAVNNTWVRVSAVTADPAATAAVTFTAAP
ncbi:molybdopterin oxidoreductase family protein [Nocardia cyriacigeorgica]|uniref:molybdopterin oxidoreductase family protein n=1 Tax=Nocardia cyriacigeorgica TaxID=135487 RepID=UPI0018961965|nr:molybdopterin oxidoreductase family protein [Nocardia cyriacigeorgica]MBF6097341.1 molybdopterin oxidoreductase family protein [Nocardia cyriacigeorgica]MBF6318751.1 molybdopterin oxidoreductase family protein [Nocardia cyriacigeorgica]MBF6344066.1 molybdopterin oxidoreductase family protein [Nocardia cyriacigeorgica]MBF6513336.1 molybdopterin oxidoreductase family protein [Nocardia cyriacigeorgica]MBF6531738.1 molybdopterin oxidoreductase family protein [Nocardia cyriacigeorgica]